MGKTNFIFTINEDYEQIDNIFNIYFVVGLLC